MAANDVNYVKVVVMESLIIGFCKCARCGWSSGNFNWHTYFKCENCGCKQYIKERNLINENDKPEQGNQGEGELEEGS